MKSAVQIYLICAISMLLLASNAHSKCIEIESAESIIKSITTFPALTDLRQYHNTAEATGWNEDGYSVFLESTIDRTYFETIRRRDNRIVDIGYWFNGKIYENHSIGWGYDREKDYHPVGTMEVYVTDEDELEIIARYIFDYDLEKHMYEGYEIYHLEKIDEVRSKIVKIVEKKFKYEDGKTYECDAENEV